MKTRRLLSNAWNNAGVLRDATRIFSPMVMARLAGPALRGLLLQVGKAGPRTQVPTGYDANFDWRYQRDEPGLARLYSAAKTSQWNAETDLDWSQTVDPHHPERRLIDDEVLPLSSIAGYRRLPRKEQEKQKHAVLAWMLSQFLHGEQGALFAACQLTEAYAGLDGKLYGSTQAVDEGRHVEVFHRYLTEKLEKLYSINDNLYVLIDALMRDERWDLKFLSMQIMIEGLALSAFGTLRGHTDEPLLRELLRYVITDEARHVHFGVLALQRHYREGLDEREIREREDWAFETSVLMRNRFLAHEVYEEYYAHAMSRRAWDKAVLESAFMVRFRTNLFRRIVPNLKRIGLLGPRIRPYYEQLGLLDFEHGKAAPELSVEELWSAA
jgi:hypothetical protein